MTKNASLVVLLLTVSLSGCLGGSGEDPQGEHSAPAEGASYTQALEDPQGDARLYNRDFIRSAAGKPCRLSGATIGPLCGAALSTVLQQEPFEEVGIPAPPSLDLVGVRLGETADSLIVELDVAALDEDFGGVFTDEPEGQRGYAFVQVCWQSEQEGTIFEIVEYECVSFSISRPESDVILLPEGHTVFSHACSWWWWCHYEVPFEVVYGSPGTFRWEVPRWTLPMGGQGESLDWVWARVTMRIADPAGAFVGYWLTEEEEQQPLEWGGIRSSTGYRVDEAGPDGPFTFQTPAAPPPPPPEEGGFQIEDAVMDPTIPDREDLEILRTDLVETPEVITIATQLALVEEAPRDHFHYVAFSPYTTGQLYFAGFHVEDGKRIQYATTADDWLQRGTRSLPVHMDVTAGRPGWLNLTFERSDLEPIKRGDRLGLLYGVAGVWEGVAEDPGTTQAGPMLTMPSPGLPGHAYRGDWFSPPPSYRFAHDPPDAPLEITEGIVVEGARGDARLPPTTALDVAREANYDITHASATPREPGISMLALGIDDPSHVAAPAGYDAVVYAVALETTDGTIMAGYYKGEGALGSAGFFCAPDTLVFASSPRDPHTVGWREIKGWVPVTEEGAPGEFLLRFPHDCVGPDAAEALEVSRLGGGTYLIGGPLPGEEVVVVDHLLSDPAAGPHLLIASRRDDDLQAQAAFWYQDPFGISEFWDIAGLAFAALLALGGAFLWQRHRVLLRRYLAEIQRASTVHAKRPRARETALLEIRDRVKKDFDRDRLRDEHFVLLEQRLDTALAKARIAGLEDAFGDLPMRLVSRLQEMLADGVLSPRDYRTITTMLDESPLEKTAKAALRVKLARWLEQDANEIPEHPLVRP